MSLKPTISQSTTSVAELAALSPLSIPTQDISFGHQPVLLQEVISLLVTKPAGYYLDGTLGLGGHSKAILEQAGTGAKLLGLDRDLEALTLAKERLKPHQGQVFFAQSCFADFETATNGLNELGWEGLDGVLVDLGVSSLQIDNASRGFSFLTDGPLDMRMDQSSGESAEILVNRAPVQRLKEIIEIYGEDPMAGRIARAIDDARSLAPISSTLQLAKIVDAAYPAKWRATSKNHPATRTFQALRMVVNQELEQLQAFLESIVPHLNVGGRLAVISFHSLEDRMVKHFFRTTATDCLCPPRVIKCFCKHEAALKIITKKALLASEDELLKNSRARSAKLRVAERTAKNFSLPALIQQKTPYKGSKGKGRAR